MKPKAATDPQAMPCFECESGTLLPVTLDHIHQIFKPYGEVLRIITFHKARDEKGS